MGTHASTVSRAGPTASDVSTAAAFAWRIEAGSGANPINPADFPGDVFPSGTGTVPAGQGNVAILFTSKPDTLFEPDETGVLIVTTTQAGVTIEGSPQSFTLLNDDANPGGTVVYPTTSIADTGYIDAGGPNYRIAGTIADTAWEIYTGGQDSDGQPGFVHYPNGNSIRTSGAFIDETGARTVTSQWSNIPNEPTGTGVPFVLEVAGPARKLTIAGVLVKDVPSEGFNFGTFVRFRTGGAAQPVTITRLA